MRFKLLIALVADDKTDEIMRVAREAGATGATVVGDARGEGLNPKKTFFGLTRVGNPAPVFKPGRAAVVSFPQGTSADRIAIDYSSEKTSLELLGAPAIPLGP